MDSVFIPQYGPTEFRRLFASQDLPCLLEPTHCENNVYLLKNIERKRNWQRLGSREIYIEPTHREHICYIPVSKEERSQKQIICFLTLGLPSQPLRYVGLESVIY
jgi:hypothetical protein